MSASRTISMVNVGSIRVMPGRRRVDPAWVETIKASISQEGLLQPIEVLLEADGFRLISGAHRLKAVAALGLDLIPAQVKTEEEFREQSRLRIREITENLIRRKLSVLDYSVDIADWRDIYTAANYGAKRGRPRKVTEVTEDELSANFALSFSEAAQISLGISRRTTFYCLKIASIAAEVRDRIALHAIADNQSELLALAAEPAERQVSIAALLTAEPAQATNVAEAIALIDRTPKPATEPRWQKLAEGFSRLKEREQDAFFELHEAAIARWQKARAS